MRAITRYPGRRPPQCGRATPLVSAIVGYEARG